MMWYATAELCHVSVQYIGVRNLGGAEWYVDTIPTLSLGGSQFPRPYVGI
jgi:hypothetical protein